MSVNAEQFIGMSKKRAQDVAEFQSLVFRLVSVDGEKFLGYPEEAEPRTDRICIEIENGAVVKATVQ
jgi:hypothetical protein